MLKVVALRFGVHPVNGLDARIFSHESALDKHGRELAFISLSGYALYALDNNL